MDVQRLAAIERMAKGGDCVRGEVVLELAAALRAERNRAIGVCKDVALKWKKDQCGPALDCARELSFGHPVPEEGFVLVERDRVFAECETLCDEVRAAAPSFGDRAQTAFDCSSRIHSRRLKTRGSEPLLDLVRVERERAAKVVEIVSVVNSNKVLASDYGRCLANTIREGKPPEAYA